MAGRVAAWAVAAALLVGLAGCGGVAPSAGSGQGGMAAVRPPAFGEAQPVDWPGHPPSSYPVHGIDVSKFQGPIDWPRAHAAGANFAYIKATEGGDRVDDRFLENWQGAGRANVARGAYHFFYFCTPAAVQARWFLENVPRDRGALPPALDLEWNPQSPTCTYRPPPEVVRAEAQIFLDLVERGYGQRPVIYTDPAFFERNELVRFAGEEVWLRATAAHPTDRYGVQGWSFWQYSGTGLVPGIAGPVDLNVFGGSAAEWRDWLARRAL